MGNLGGRTCKVDDLLAELEHGELVGVTNVDGAGVLAGHEADHSFDIVVAVAEGAGLGAVTVDGDFLSPESLHNEVGRDRRRHSCAGRRC